MYGVFVWGVLEWLLEDDSIEIVVISGILVGVLNGVVLVVGLVKGLGKVGCEVVWENLDYIWLYVS